MTFALLAEDAGQGSPIDWPRKTSNKSPITLTRPSGKCWFGQYVSYSDGMGYESLSTVVVLVIVIIAIAVWLPARTANGMKRAAEHRQDRYSPSLRIVEAEDGRRFGDIRAVSGERQAMPASTQSARLTTEHIAHIRELRRESIRRRQPILVAAFSPWP